MTGVIVAFVLGSLFGATLIILNGRCVKTAIAQERKHNDDRMRKLQQENARLWAENNSLNRERDMQDAYCRGRGERR